jgi:hypothetical protein
MRGPADTGRAHVDETAGDAATCATTPANNQVEFLRRAYANAITRQDIRAADRLRRLLDAALNWQAPS